MTGLIILYSLLMLTIGAQFASKYYEDQISEYKAKNVILDNRMRISESRADLMNLQIKRDREFLESQRKEIARLKGGKKK